VTEESQSAREGETDMSRLSVLVVVAITMSAVAWSADSGGGALARTRSGESEHVGIETFTWWIDLGGFDVEVAPDSVVKVTVTGDAPGRFGFPTKRLSVKAVLQNGKELDGAAEATMTSRTRGTPLDSIINKGDLHSIEFLPDAKQPTRGSSGIRTEITTISGCTLTLTNTVRYGPLGLFTPQRLDFARFFKEVGPGAPLVALAGGDGNENLVTASVGHFGVHAELKHIDAIESMDVHQEALVPWAGDPSKRPGAVAKIRNSNVRLWPRFQIVGTSEYGWTRVWVPQQVRRAAFHCGQLSPVEILGRAQVGPPATVEDTLGVKLSGRMVA
jgi:hypothetical protein